MRKELSVSEETFGTLCDGRLVKQFILTNQFGTRISVIEYGGILHEIITLDATGKPADIVLGMKDIEGYQQHHPHYGGLIGRFANRIAEGKFSLGDESYQIAVKEGALHSLHGGREGFDKKLWEGELWEEDHKVGVTLTYTSENGEEGFPGTLQCKVHYSLNDRNELRLFYTAETDRPTVVNFTNHSYFNLQGQDSESICDHVVQIHAHYYIPTDKDGIPSGEVLTTSDTPFDFRKPKVLRKLLTSNQPQIQQANGFDHTLVLAQRTKESPWDGRVTDPQSGRFLEFKTSEPGVQFYTGNHLSKTEVLGKNGKKPLIHQALCLETQHFPDSPNQPHFPSTRLNPGERFHSETVFHFGLQSSSDQEL